MIHRIRMWLWERKRVRLERDRALAMADRDEAALEHRRAWRRGEPTYEALCVWECFDDEVTMLHDEIAHHESRRPKP